MKPVQSYCKRCEKLFCYWRRCSRRLYCSPICIELERRDEIEFAKVQRRKQAIAKAHQQRTARHFSRFPDGSLFFERAQ